MLPPKHRCPFTMSNRNMHAYPNSKANSKGDYVDTQKPKSGCVHFGHVSIVVAYSKGGDDAMMLVTRGRPCGA